MNLVEASQVILLDPMFNPYSERQAIDRVHRIGQKKEVRIWRPVGKGTEERIVERRRKKVEFVETALEELGKMSAERLEVEDLGYLLFGNGRARQCI